MNAQLETRYKLISSSGSQQIFTATVDSEHRTLDIPESYHPPEWALLDFNQCQHCPLKKDTDKYCPIAKNMAYLLNNAQFDCSHTEVVLEVTSGHRVITSETTMQRALSSLFGLVCGLSNCPYTRPFRPMAIFHLPLSSDVETLFRAVSLFLMRAYFAHQDNPEKPINLDEMQQTYQDLALLNKGLAQRFRSAHSSDSHTNAVVLLDILARDVSFEMEDQLNILKDLL